jgi:hypothetical protein
MIDACDFDIDCWFEMEDVSDDSVMDREEDFVRPSIRYLIILCDSSYDDEPLESLNSLFPSQREERRNTSYFIFY